MDPHLTPRLVDRLLARRPRSPVPARLAELLEAEPIRALDVGAARGVPWHWRPFLDHLRVDAFEPNATECARLAASSHPHIHWHPTALAANSGPRDLHVLATPTGSSFYPPAPEFVEMFGIPEYSAVDHVESLDCISLEEHLGEQPAPHLIKLDTQGSELEILSGMRRDHLDEVLAVELEIELHEAYEGQPLFPEVHAFMVGAGLRLLDFRVQRTHLTGGTEELHFLRKHLSTAVGSRALTAQAHAVDAVYIRPLGTPTFTQDAAQFARYATILQLYRYYDGVFWLLAQPGIEEVFGPQERFEITNQFEQAAPRPRLLDRTGRLPQILRRARRAASFAFESATRSDGFDPPRSAWTRTYWPDT